MLRLFLIIINFYLLVLAQSDSDTKEVSKRCAKCKTARVNQFPHAAFLDINCHVKGHYDFAHYMCGASILNERILLSAAHCFLECSPRTWAFAGVGTIRTLRMKKILCRSFMMHEKYLQDLSEVGYDIALIKLKTDLKFDESIQRVALLRNPPYDKAAQVVGWGYLDEADFKNKIKTLLVATQYAYPECDGLMKKVPQGALCASSKRGVSDGNQSYEGDAGSALLVDGYIQIGVVSHRLRNKDVVVYMDIGFFYDWIKTHMEQLYCHKSIKGQSKG